MQSITNIADLNEINCLEHGSIKIPYEILNKKFRASQRNVDKYCFHSTNEISLLLKKLQEQKNNTPVNQVI